MSSSRFRCALARSSSVPDPWTGEVPRSYFHRCTADGIVFVQSVDSASCAFVDGVHWSFEPEPGLLATKLLATDAGDARTPWTSCTYVIAGRDLTDLGDR